VPLDERDRRSSDEQTAHETVPARDTRRTATRALGFGAATAILLACWTTACTSGTNGAPVAATWRLDPTSPASHAETRLQLTLRDASGRPVRGARLRVEAHMSHPGMAPVLADAREQSDGIYAARLDLTMAGHWTLVATGELADGTSITRTLDGVVVR
jgi:hypothetical protein